MCYSCQRERKEEVCLTSYDLLSSGSTNGFGYLDNFFKHTRIGKMDA